jgi:hypothetical protein
MATQIVGYRLRNVATNEIVQSWGGVWGQCPGIPSLLVLPAVQVCAPSLGVDYDGHVLEAWEMEEPPPSVPEEISDRQFFQQAAVQGIITQAEALAAVQTGTIPSALQTIVDGIVDANERFAAQMILSGATAFRRSHPLTASLGAAFSWTPEQIDAFFIAAAQV